MAFKSVFKALRDVFPQIDLRILKAVASEYYEDVDAAVEFVLSEVLPTLSEPTEPHYNLHVFDDAEHSHSNSGMHGNDKVSGNQSFEDGVALVMEPLTKGKNVVRDDDTSATPGWAQLLDNGVRRSFPVEDLAPSNESKLPSTQEVEAYMNTQSESQFVEREPHLVAGHKAVPLQSEPISIGELEASASLSNLINHGEISNKESTNDFKLVDSAVLLEQNFEAETRPISPAFHANVQDILSLYPEMNINSTAQSSAEFESAVKLVCTGYDNQSSGVATQSSQSVQVDLLDELISDMTKSKETFGAALESTITKMKEVEIHEEKAKRTKEEAAMADQDILAKIEDLGQMIKSAQESNDKQAGEVNMEKYQLKCQAEELQCRLIDLSAQRENSLLLVEEISHTLDARLAAAKEEEAAAKREVVERQESARRALKEQEATMQNILHELQRLQKQAEENAMLKNLLMDRGHLVEILQREISLIFEDVASLKERVDAPMLLAASNLATAVYLSENQPNQPTLSEGAEHHSTSENPMPTNNDLPENKTREISVEDHKASIDDDWELF
ncbi:CAP-Gly domain-containing linker protein 1-like [Ananas comosus]|uniref:CAP-Gly domain-containing linker protein 1-like n=1 Tax=Ananas comosus TaxID=4615 RepID=A0A6P5H1Z3_ANACO|nr:CAP-Gly domain-containing linker protein 1-like [Ananas comosus]